MCVHLHNWNTTKSSKINSWNIMFHSLFYSCRNFTLCHEVFMTDACDPHRALCLQPGEAVERMVDGGTTIRSKRAAVISVGFVYFYITSVHPRGNLTSRERSVSPFPLLRGWGFISEAMMNSRQTSTPYGPWVSMHLNEAFLPLPRTTQGLLNSLSCQALHQTQ